MIKKTELDDSVQNITWCNMYYCVSVSVVYVSLSFFLVFLCWLPLCWNQRASSVQDNQTTKSSIRPITLRQVSMSYVGAITSYHSQNMLQHLDCDILWYTGMCYTQFLVLAFLAFQWFSKPYNGILPFVLWKHRTVIASENG